MGTADRLSIENASRRRSETQRKENALIDMLGALCDLELPVLVAGKNRTELSDLKNLYQLAFDNHNQPGKFDEFFITQDPKDETIV